MRLHRQAKDRRGLVVEPPVLETSLNVPLPEPSDGLSNDTTEHPHEQLRGHPKAVWLGYSDVIAAIWLIGSLLCLCLALCLRVGDDRHVYFVGWSQPIPETCMAYSRFGINCPGCGLTRAFVHLVRGQVWNAWQLNPIGICVFAFVCLQIPSGVSQLLFRSRHRWVESWSRWNEWGTAALLMALVLQWLVGLGQRMLT